MRMGWGWGWGVYCTFSRAGRAWVTQQPGVDKNLQREGGWWWVGWCWLRSCPCSLKPGVYTQCPCGWPQWQDPVAWSAWHTKENIRQTNYCVCFPALSNISMEKKKNMTIWVNKTNSSIVNRFHSWVMSISVVFSQNTEQVRHRRLSKKKTALLCPSMSG